MNSHPVFLLMFLEKWYSNMETWYTSLARCEFASSTNFFLYPLAFHSVSITFYTGRAVTMNAACSTILFVPSNALKLAKCRKHSPLLWLNPAKVEMPRWPHLDIFTHVQTGLTAPTSYCVSSLNLFVLIEHGRMRYLVPRTEEFELHRRPIGDEQS